MIKELGPVLTALMLTGRVGSGIAAELGSMVVTDQINALRALGTDPIRKLVVPRVLAGFFMAPVLTVISDFVGIVGGWMVARFQLQVASGVYWSSVTEALYMQDVWMGLIKPFVLGFVIVTIACHVGLRTKGGTQGVGKATTVAVVAGSVAVIAVDFFVTQDPDRDDVLTVAGRPRRATWTRQATRRRQEILNEPRRAGRDVRPGASWRSTRRSCSRTSASR